MSMSAVSYAYDFSKSAVVYFSTRNNTPNYDPSKVGSIERIAKEFSAQTQAPIFEIKTPSLMERLMMRPLLWPAKS